MVLCGGSRPVDPGLPGRRPDPGSCTDTTSRTPAGATSSEPPVATRGAPPGRARITGVGCRDPRWTSLAVASPDRSRDADLRWTSTRATPRAEVPRRPRWSHDSVGLGHAHEPPSAGIDRDGVGLARAARHPRDDGSAERRAGPWRRWHCYPLSPNPAQVPAERPRHVVRLADQRAGGRVQLPWIPGFLRPLVPLSDQQTVERAESVQFSGPVRPLVRLADQGSSRAPRPATTLGCG